VLGLMRAMAGALHAEGLIDVDDLDALTQLLFGCITAAALTLSRSPDPESERVRLRAVVLRIVEGLRPFG
jgi:hypothetical protein